MLSRTGWVLTSVATGAEACAHLSEETKRPTRNVPMAIFWSTAVSYIFGWIVRLHAKLPDVPALAE